MQLRALAHRCLSFSLNKQAQAVGSDFCTRAVKPRNQVDEEPQFLNDDDDDALPELLAEQLTGDLSDLSDLTDLSDLSDCEAAPRCAARPAAKPVAGAQKSSQPTPMAGGRPARSAPGTAAPPLAGSAPCQPPLPHKKTRRGGKNSKSRKDWTPEQRARDKQAASYSARTKARRIVRLERRIEARQSSAHLASKHVSQAQQYASSAKVASLAANQSVFIAARAAPQGVEGHTQPVYRGGFCTIGLRATSRSALDFAARQLAGPPKGSTYYTRRLVHEFGYTYVPSMKEAQVFTDADGLIYAVKPPQPAGDQWGKDMDYLLDRLQTLRSDLKLSAEENVKHGRGEFDRMSCGSSHGGGRKHPTVISPDWKRNKEVMLKFFQDPVVQKVCRHLERCFFTWFPEVAKFYQDLERELAEGGFNLKEVFGPGGETINLPFAAQTLNLGPHVRCLLHRDSQNIKFGVCSSLTIGRFDHERSGHFVIVETKVVLELKHGDVLLFLSSLLTHGNAPLRQKELRMSWTCWTAGGLVRWVAAGHALLASLNTASKQHRYLKNAARYSERSWRALLTLGKLQKYHAAAERAEDVEGGKDCANGDGEGSESLSDESASGPQRDYD